MLRKTLEFIKRKYKGLLRRIKDLIIDKYTTYGRESRYSFAALTWRTTRYRAAGIGLPLTKNEKCLLEYKDRHKDERAFILGNGPSLNRCNLRVMDDEITFGVNAIYLNYENMGFYPTYYVVEDPFVAEDRANEINAYQSSTKFFGNYLRLFLKESPDTIWLNIRYNYRDYPNFPHFSCNAARMVWVGGTVSYICLQLAYYMGFSEIYLIGFDHSYFIPSDAKISGVNILSMSNDPNHFSPHYFGKGYRWHDPQVERMELSYRHTKQEFEKAGRRIFNATIGGKLEVFERVDYQQLFRTKLLPKSVKH